MRRRIWTCALLSLAVLGGCARPQPARAPSPSPLPTPPPVVAEWKGGKLTRERLERRVKVMLASAGVKPSDPAASRRAEAFRVSAARDLVDLLLLDEHHRERPRRLVAPAEREVDRRWRQAEQKRGRQALLESLRAWGVGEREVREELRLEALRDVYLLSLAEEEPVAEEFVRREYDHNRHLYRIPDRYRIRGILTRTRDEAERARAEVLSGKDFAEVARRYSKDEKTAPRGGEVGWLEDTRMHPWVLQAVRPLRKGQVSPVFAGPGGWYLVRLEDVRPGRALSYPEARPLIVRSFKLSGARTTLSGLLAQLRREKEVVFHWPSPEPAPRKTP